MDTTSDDVLARRRAALPRDAEEAPRARARKRWPWFVAAGVLAAVALAPPVADHVLAGVIERKVRAEVRNKCPACTLELGGVDVSVLRGRATARDVRFREGDGDRTQIDLRAQRIEVTTAVWSLVRGTPHVRRVLVRGAHVALTKYPDRPATPYDPRPVLLGAPPLRVDAVDLEGLTVDYGEHAEPRRAGLVFANVSAHVGAFGTRPGLAPRMTDFRARGALPGGGEGALAGRVDALSPGGALEAAFDARGYDLDGLDTYLSLTDAMGLDGRVDRVRVAVRVADGRLRGTVAARYSGLSADFRRRDGRDPLRAALQNVGEDLRLREAGATPEGHPGFAFEATRGADEKLLSFVWRAVERGVLEYVTRPADEAERVEEREERREERREEARERERERARAR